MDISQRTPRTGLRPVGAAAKLGCRDEDTVLPPAGKGVCVFAVVRQADASAIEAVVNGALGDVVRCAPCGLGLAALVGAVDAVDGSPLHELKGIHARALACALDAFTVLPLRFGVLAQGVSDVRRAVAEQAEHLTAQLSALDGMIEVRVSATWDLEAARRTVIAEHPRLRAIHHDLTGRDEHTTTHQRTEFERRVGAALKTRRLLVRQDQLLALDDLSSQSVVFERDDALTVLDAAFLAARADEPALAARIEAIAEAHRETVTLTYAAPVPPYTFAPVRLAMSAPAMVEAA